MEPDVTQQPAPVRLRRGRRVVVVAAVIAVALAAVVWFTGGEPACTERIPGVRPGVCLGDPQARPAASVAAGPVLGDPDRQIGLPDFLGDVVVVNFWASWCGPCRSEQPALNEAAADLADLGVVFLGVNAIDDSTFNALAHEEEFAIPYPSIEDQTGRYAASYEGVGANVMPSTVLIDRQGRVAANFPGEVGYGDIVGLARLLALEE